MTNLSAALAYAESGHAVFGLQPGAKTPYGGTRGFYDASRDSSTVREWWGLTDRDDGTVPDSNIGNRPDADEFVIDVDVRADGYATLADRVIQLGPLPEDAPVTRTATGGRHIRLSYDGGDLVGSLGPGVDIKGHSGYVVMPPSVIEVWDDDDPRGLPRGEHRYTWEKPLTPSSPEAPTAWLARVVKPQAKVQPKTRKEVEHVGNTRYVDAVVSDTLAELRDTPPHGGRHGGRNNSLNAAALRLARLGVQRVWLRTELTAACENNGLVADNGLRAVEATINSAFAKADRDGPASIPEPPSRNTQAANGGTARRPDNDGDTTEFDDDDTEPTTWEPVDLGPYLRAEIEQPKPSMGIARADGLRLIYPGREHAVLGETESGKTWFALGCVATELIAGNGVLYIHYEEPDAGSTIERLRLLGVTDDMMERQLRFVAPMRAVHKDWLATLLNPLPTLVVHDGVNEAMSLHVHDIMAADGAARFRRNLVLPFTRAGAAVLACDHLSKDRERRGRDAYGSVHKGNALDGARILLENETPFGRGLRGASFVFVTKDRPGYLRAHGRPTRTPGKTFIGVLVVDDSKQPFEPFEMPFFAPKDDDDKAGNRTDVSNELTENVYQVIAALPDRTAPSIRQLCAEIRRAGQALRRESVCDAVDDLVLAGRIVEVPGKRNAIGYRAVSSASQESDT
jgi:Bifunctional DNA primase/polymerase, N-terminal